MSDIKFRSSLWTVIRLNSIYCLGYAIFIPFFVLWIDSFGNLKYSVAYVSLLLTLMVCAFGICYCIYAVYAFGITVKETGIYGYDLWGNYSFVAWSEIDRVEPYSIWGCRYLRLFFANSNVPLWISLFLVEQDKFNRIVIQRTKQSNPLHFTLTNLDTLLNKIPWHGKPKNISSLKNKYSNNDLKLNSTTAKNKNIAPWMAQNVFIADLKKDTHGYCQGEKLFVCSRSSLIENVKLDSKKLINLVWTSDTPNLVAPEEVSWLIDALNAREKSYYKQALKNDLANVLIWGWIFYSNLTAETAVRQIMLFNWLAISVIPAIEHSWGLYQCRINTQERLIQRSQQNRYTAWVKSSNAPWTELLVGSISLVAIVQAIVFFIPNLNSSIETAGIVKPLVREGEIWRLLTGTLLHGNLIHFMFNIFALSVLGKLIEITAHRVYVPIVFLITALCGSVASLLLIPDITSVGASGGIMGLLGFLLILAVKNQHMFPLAHQQMLLKGAVYTFFAGLLAYQVIDNPAHIGGFLGGILLGWILARDRATTIPMKRVSHPLKIMGIISASAIAMTVLLAIFQMIGLS